MFMPRGSVEINAVRIFESLSLSVWTATEIYECILFHFFVTRVFSDFTRNISRSFFFKNRCRAGKKRTKRKNAPIDFVGRSIFFFQSAIMSAGLAQKQKNREGGGGRQAQTQTGARSLLKGPGPHPSPLFSPSLFSSFTHSLLQKRQAIACGDENRRENTAHLKGHFL